MGRFDKLAVYGLTFWRQELKVRGGEVEVRQLDNLI